MCGINGVFNHNSFEDVEKKVISMNGLTTHRGPDSSNIYKDQKVTLKKDFETNLKTNNYHLLLLQEFFDSLLF